MDQELALINTLKIVFPKAANLLCKWHISKVVLTYIKREKIFKKKGQWDDDEKVQEEEVSKQDNFIMWFAALIGSNIIESYQSRLLGIQYDYTQHPWLLQYIQKTWTRPWVNKFIKAYTDRYLHLGNRVTSKIEGGHSILKNYLQISTGDLKIVLEKVQLLLKSQYIKYNIVIANFQDKIIKCLIISFFFRDY